MTTKIQHHCIKNTFLPFFILLTLILLPGCYDTGDLASNEAGEPASTVEATSVATGTDITKSPNDPHKPKNIGTWYEGWYTRITDANSSRSIAVLGVSNLTEGETYTSGDYMPGYILVVVGQGDGGPTYSFEVFPEETIALVDGQPVTANPDFASAADFEWIAPGYGTITENSIDIEIPGSFSVNASIGERLPWNSVFTEAGPEGLLAFLPLPMHWHIDSLGSDCDFEYIISEPGLEEHVVSQGWAHREKNWGTLFPTGRSWGQAISDNNQSQIVWGGGKVEMLGLNPELWLLGYRSPKITWDFNIAMPGTKITGVADDAAGTFNIKAKSPYRTLEIVASAPEDTYASVATPSDEGWVLDNGGQSFSATIRVTAYRHTWLGGLLGWRIKVDERTFYNGCLEYGTD